MYLSTTSGLAWWGIWLVFTSPPIRPPVCPPARLSDFPSLNRKSSRDARTCVVTCRIFIHLIHPLVLVFFRTEHRPIITSEFPVLLCFPMASMDCFFPLRIRNIDIRCAPDACYPAPLFHRTGCTCDLCPSAGLYDPFSHTRSDQSATLGNAFA